MSLYIKEGRKEKMVYTSDTIDIEETKYKYGKRIEFGKVYFVYTDIGMGTKSPIYETVGEYFEGMEYQWYNLLTQDNDYIEGPGYYISDQEVDGIRRIKCSSYEDMINTLKRMFNFLG